MNGKIEYRLYFLCKAWTVQKRMKQSIIEKLELRTNFAYFTHEMSCKQAERHENLQVNFLACWAVAIPTISLIYWNEINTNDFNRKSMQNAGTNGVKLYLLISFMLASNIPS